MERKPQKPESALSGTRSSSISRFVKNAYDALATKKDRLSSESPPPGTPTPTAEPELDKDGKPKPRIFRPPQPTTPNCTEVDLRNQTAALATGLGEQWPHRHKSRYKEVRALLVCWADNDIHPHVPDAFVPPPLPSPALQSSSPSVYSQRLSSESELAASLRRISSRYNIALSRHNTNEVPQLRRVSSLANTAFGSTHPANEPDMRSGPFIPAAEELGRVFTDRYGIPSQVWMIPSVDSPQDALAAKLRQFVHDYGGQDNLLIFWYGGRAEFVGGAWDSDSRTGEVIWYGLRDKTGVSAKTATRVLGEARADVLILNDSPFSQYTYAMHANNPRSFELLGSGSMTPSNVELNPRNEAWFTRSMSLLLDSPHLAARGLSVLDIHHKIIDNLAAAPFSRASVATTSSGAAPVGSSTPIAIPSQPTSPPHAPSSSMSSASPIATPTTASHPEITPGPRRASGQSAAYTTHRPPSYLIPSRARPVSSSNMPCYPIYCQINQPPQLERDARRCIVLSHHDASFAVPYRYALHQHLHHANSSNDKGKGKGKDKEKEAGPGVRLDFKLQRHFLDVKKWKEWILSAPPDAEGVVIKGLGEK